MNAKMLRNILCALTALLTPDYFSYIFTGQAGIGRLYSATVGAMDDAIGCILYDGCPAHVVGAIVGLDPVIMSYGILAPTFPMEDGTD